MKKSAWIEAVFIVLIYAVLSFFLRDADPEGGRAQMIGHVSARESWIPLWEYDLYWFEAEDLYRELADSGEIPWYGEVNLLIPIKPNGLAWGILRLDPGISDAECDEYERTVAEILDRTVHPGMSDMQIALSVHDYLVAHCAYDETYSDYTAYDALVRGKAVCHGYAAAYRDLLLRCGIECCLVQSSQMNHAWNLVKLDGSWYHVDATWDDPTPDLTGRVNHGYFLLSDEAIGDVEHNHYGWETDLTCRDTRYDDGGFWKELDSPVWYADAEGCYLRRATEDGSGIFRRDASSGTETELHHLQSRSVDLGSGSRNVPAIGLTLAGGMLYYAEADRIWRLDLQTGEPEQVLKYPPEQTQRWIRSSHVQEKMLSFVTVDAQGNTESKQRALSYDSVHTHRYSQQRTEPTCASGGYTEHTCDCGVSFRTEQQLPDGVHLWLDGSCTVCGAAEEADPGILVKLWDLLKTAWDFVI